MTTLLQVFKESFKFYIQTKNSSKMEQGKCERELRHLTGRDRGYKQTRKMGELREVDNKARHPNNTLFLESL